MSALRAGARINRCESWRKEGLAVVSTAWLAKAQSARASEVMPRPFRRGWNPAAWIGSAPHQLFAFVPAGKARNTQCLHDIRDGCCNHRHGLVCRRSRACPATWSPQLLLPGREPLPAVEVKPSRSQELQPVRLCAVDRKTGRIVGKPEVILGPVVRIARIGPDKSASRKLAPSHEKPHSVNPVSQELAYSMDAQEVGRARLL